MTQLLIVGCGLIGGSVALAAKRATPGLEIIGVDWPEVLRGARFAEVFDRGLSAGDSDDALLAAARNAELTILATPVRTILAALPRLSPHAGLVTDCGSTKRQIATAGRTNPNFVPGHPMAGRPSGSLATADASLFEGRHWILCDDHCSPQALSRVEAFVGTLGAQPITLCAADHDQGVAMTSHVPQLFASALAVLGSIGPARCTQGPAFHSATRVAGGPASIWTDILETNADSVASALQRVAARLEEIAAALDQGDSKNALRLLEEARKLRDAKP